MATLVRNTSQGLSADQIPLILAAGVTNRLQGHVARANPLAAEAAEGGEVLLIFQGPNAYISPGWYASKAEDPRVVPTWNYAVVHLHGTLRCHSDSRWLTRHLTQLTASQEVDRSIPWQIADAPAEHIERLQQHIVGIEIEIRSVIGKVKASQNQPEVNRASVVEALRNTPQGQPMADLVASFDQQATL
ncbi:MAG: FMN-binding negative transcriptional regulator [Pseudomonadales bacterium]